MNIEKNNKKCSKKLFTKNKAKDIINKNYNPLKVNCRLIYKRRDGLYKMKDMVLHEFIKELNFIERIFFKKKFIKIYKKGIEKGFNSRM